MLKWFSTRVPRASNGERTVFSIVFFFFLWENWISTYRKKKLDPYLQAQSKNELKMDQRPKQRYKTIELLQETKGESFMLLVLAMISYIWHQRHEQQKKNKLDFIKMKNFGTSKDAMNIRTRQLIEWEKIFANHIPNEGLTLKERIPKTQQQKSINVIKKFSKDFLKRHFSKEDK